MFHQVEWNYGFLETLFAVVFSSLVDFWLSKFIWSQSANLCLDEWNIFFIYPKNVRFNFHLRCARDQPEKGEKRIWMTLH